MGWTYTTKVGVTGWWYSLDGHTDFASDDYYNAARAANESTTPNGWHTTGVYPTASPYFDDFFYTQSEFDAEVAGGLEMTHAALLASTLYSSPDTNPNSNRSRVYPSRFITNFQEYSQGPKAGLYAFYGYCVVDSYEAGPGGPIGPPVFTPPSTPDSDGPIRPTGPPTPIPPRTGPEPGPPTKPPAVPIPSPEPIESISLKIPCVNDDGSITEVEDPADCPPTIPLKDVLDDIPDLDIIEIPVEDGDDTGQLVTWQPVFPSGIDRPNAIFAWDRAPRNLNTIDSLDDGQATINELVCVGAQVDGINLTVTVVDQDSIDAIGRYWASESFSFATDIATLRAMGEARLRKYRMGAHVVTFDPAPGAETLPKPWADFDISDTVRVRASSKLRGGFDPTIHTIFGHTLDVQRVNGWDLELDNDTDSEKLVKLYTEEDLG